jgi:hypothetical protein
MEIDILEGSSFKRRLSLDAYAPKSHAPFAFCFASLLDGETLDGETHIWLGICISRLCGCFCVLFVLISHAI